MSVENKLSGIRGNAPHRSPTVRVLAAYAPHTDCNLATLGFVAGVDFDQLLAGTSYEVPFGQSPFAFMRGIAFENAIRHHGYAAALNLLREKMGFAISDARIINLRNLYPKNSVGMRLRAHETRSLVRQIIRGDRNAPNLIDGAVLETAIGGIHARFEADALAARFDGPIHAGEVKSFPVVDERADPDKLRAALDQVSIYILLTKKLVADIGGDPDVVSATALLFTPKNVGLTPTLSSKDVTKYIARIERLFASVPDIGYIVGALPPDVNFGAVADTRPLKARKGQDPAQARRIDVFHDLADRVGTTYKSHCLSTCGNAYFCRDRAFRAGSTCLTGPHTVRLLPGVRSLTRADELTRGAPPATEEAQVAPLLARAGRLYDEAVEELRAAQGRGRGTGRLA